MVSDAMSEGFYTSLSGKKYPRLQLLTIDGLLNGTQRPEQPDYEPNINFKKATTESHAQQIAVREQALARAGIRDHRPERIIRFMRKRSRQLTHQGETPDPRHLHTLQLMIQFALLAPD